MQERRLPVAGVVACLLALVLVHAVPACALLQGTIPEQIRLSYPGDGQMSIAWNTNVTTAEVRFFYSLPFSVCRCCVRKTKQTHMRSLWCFTLPPKEGHGLLSRERITPSSIRVTSSAPRSSIMSRCPVFNRKRGTASPSTIFARLTTLLSPKILLHLWVPLQQ